MTNIQFGKFNFSNYTTQFYKVENFHEILKHESFDVEKITTLYLYGFLQTPYQSSVREIVDAYMENGEYNFVLMNYDSPLVNSIFVSWCGRFENECW